MNKGIGIVIGVLAVIISPDAGAQNTSKGVVKDIIQWKGSLQLSGEYSAYTPGYQNIPASYGYLHSNQEIAIEGIPFMGNVFLSSYQSSALNRYSFSFDSRALKQTIQERIEQKISKLEELPSINALQDKIEKIDQPVQYRTLNVLNEQLAKGEVDLESTSAYASIVQSQRQFARYNPNEYEKYEQYLQLKELDREAGYHKQLKMLEGQGIISASEKIWYNIDALQIGTATPYFSDLDLAGVPVKGYFAAYNAPYFYISATQGTTLPFSSGDSSMTFSRNIKAYKFGSGAVQNTHLHISYLHGEDQIDPTLNPGESNTVGGIDGRIQLFQRKLDVQARSYIGIHTDDVGAQSESYTVETDDITDIKGLGELLSKDVELNSSTTYGNAHHVQMHFQDKDLHVGSEWRRIDPGYHSMGLAYLQSDLQRIAMYLEKSILDKKIRLSGRVRMDEDNLNGSKPYTGRNISGLLRIQSYLKKSPQISLTYMPNFYSSRSSFSQDVRSQESHMFSIALAKSYKFLHMNQVTSGSLTYNVYNAGTSDFSSINTSLNQVISINKKLNTSVQAIYRQTNSSYYWTVRPLIRYRIANQGVVHISLRYGADYFQNTRYAFDAGTSLKINNKLIFGFSVTQNYYSQSGSIADLRIRSSLKATW
ncbi:MAG: hypothetical protein JKX74_07630 [Flavobacteriales bacterium]|nr:hypothetical protein [Flavobacteriales bacterium]